MVKNIFKGGLIILGLCFLTGISLAMGSLQQGAVTVGKIAKGFSLEDTKGNKVDTSRFIGKKPIIFFFWTTWCPHCRAQIHHLKEESDRIKNSGIELILVDIDESKAQVSDFLQGTGAPFNSLLDQDSKVAEMYQIIGVPTFVIVGVDGTIKLQDNLLPSDYLAILSKSNK